MKRRDIVIGLIVLAVLAGIIFLARRQREQPELQTTPSVEERLEESFNLEIPEDVEKIELADVSGGDSSGIATRKFEDATFTHVVLADLPEPEEGKFYEGWLVKGEEVVSTGRLRVAKGGYLLEFESSTDYSDYKTVVVSEEEIADATPEKHILEGSF